jgi:hypothetical protein
MEPPYTPEELTKLVNRLEEGLTKCYDVLGGYITTLEKYVLAMDRDLADARERIKNLELTVFPNLAKDMKQVGDIIGDSGDKSENPLDKRPH